MLWGTIKPKNSPEAHVCDHKNWMTRRRTIPFALCDRYEPKDVIKAKQNVRGCSKKFSGPMWNTKWRDVQTMLLVLLSFDWVSKLKNDHWLAFSKIKNEWDVIRPFRLLWEIAMDLMMSAKTNYKCGEDLKNILEPSKVHRHLHQRAFFGAFGVN